MNEQEALLSSNELFGSLVRQARVQHMNEATPDAGWNEHDLINHVTNENAWLPNMLAGNTVAQVGKVYDGNLIGDDVHKVWAKYARAANDAVRALDDLGKVVHLSFGDTPARDYLQQLAIDHTIHAWDLATALGIELGIDSKLADTAFGWFEPQAEAWRGAGLLAPATSAGPDATSLERLIALSGRRVS